jgi:hypothetical protein
VLFSAIIALGFSVIHTFSMIIAFNGYEEKEISDQIFVPVVHMAAAVMVRIRFIIFVSDSQYSITFIIFIKPS